MPASRHSVPLKNHRWRITVGYVGEEVYVVRALTARAAMVQARRLESIDAELNKKLLAELHR